MRLAELAIAATGRWLSSSSRNSSNWCADRYATRADVMPTYSQSCPKALSQKALDYTGFPQPLPKAVPKLVLGEPWAVVRLVGNVRSLPTRHVFADLGVLRR
jgi:hypothetical protein